MIKRVKYFYLIFLTILFIPIFVSASDIDYSNFTSEIDVSRNRTLNIKESYEIYFEKNIDTITRLINKNIKIYRKNSTGRINGSISNIKGDNITTSENRNHSIIKIKANDLDTILVDKKKKYNISYEYNLGKDYEKNYDEFYYDIVSSLDGPISSLVFNIDFPSNIENNKVEFILNGKVIDDNISYSIENNSLTGYYNKEIKANSTFSIRVQFNDGYFEKAKIKFNNQNYLILVFPFISFVLLFIYYFKYGKGTNFKSRYTYYPPNDYDSAEIGYLYKGKTEEVDLTSLIIYLANEGYLKLVENDDGYKLGRENTFNMIKLKDYDGNNAIQKLMYDGLFKVSNICDLGMIEYTFFERLMNSKKILDNNENRKKMYHLDINKPKVISVLFIIISIALISYYPLNVYSNSMFFDNYVVLIMIIIFEFGLFNLFNKYKGIFTRFLFGLLITGIGTYIAITSIIDQINYLIIFGLGYFLIILMLILYFKLSARTKYGNKMFSDIYGFKVSLETISSAKLEELLKENPNYYYDMCPYAYVLGILDKWTEKGRGIVKEKPLWHESYNQFDIGDETKFIKNVLFNTTQAMVKKDYSVSGMHIDYKKDNSGLND